jgi:phage gp29-like protein
MANDLVPFAAPAPPALVDVNGRPLRQAYDTLTREVGRATMTGIRTIHSGHPAHGLTPARLARILREAETGDATAYLELAEEMEEKDLHYQSVMGTRKRAVSQLPITVKSAGDDEQSEGDAQLLRDWLDRLTLQAELFDILDAVGKGYSATEIVWQTTTALWLPLFLKRQDPRFFEFDKETGERLLLKGGIDGTSGMPQPLPEHKFIVHHAPAKSGLPIRGGIARAAAWGYVFKNYTIKDWMAFLEVYGLPLRVGKYQPGTNEADIRVLERAVAQIGSDAGAVIPQSMMLEFITAGGAASNPEMFERKCKYIDDQLSKAVLGQTSSADAKSGGIGSGQADLHGEVRHDIESADAAQLSATLTRDLAIPMVMFNRGRRDRYPLILVGRPDAVDVEQALKSMDAAVRLGVPVGISTFRKMTGLPEPREGEELLRGAAEGLAQNPAGEPLGSGAGPVPAKTRPADLLGALKSALSGKAKAGEVSASAVTAGTPDAIDAAAEEALSDWEELMAPIAAPIEELAASAASLEAFRHGLTAIIASMDTDRLTEMLARATFASRLQGDAQIQQEQQG